MNKKGFALTETIIVSAVVLTTLVLVYTQIAKINKNYGDSYSFNSINGIYSLKQIANYLEEEKINDLYNDLSTYIDITDCNSSYYVDKNYCNLIMESANIKYLLFTYNNRNAIYSEISTSNEYDLKLLNYIKTLDDSDLEYDYRLIAEFNDNTYASIVFGGDSLYQEQSLNGTEPVLSGNLVPITIKENGEVRKADLTKDWYNYQQKRWANAVILKDSYNDLSAENKVFGAIKQNGGVYFDGTDDYINLGLANYDFGNSITMAIRLKISEIKFQEIFLNLESAGSSIYIGSDKKIGFQFYNNTQDEYKVIKYNDNLEANREYTVVATYDGASLNL